MLLPARRRKCDQRNGLRKATLGSLSATIQTSAPVIRTIGSGNIRLPSRAEPSLLRNGRQEFFMQAYGPRPVPDLGPQRVNLEQYQALTPEKLELWEGYLIGPPDWHDERRDLLLLLLTNEG